MQEILLLVLKALVQAILPELPEFLHKMFSSSESVEVHSGPLTTPDDAVLFTNDELDRLFRG